METSGKNSSFRDLDASALRQKPSALANPQNFTIHLEGSSDPSVIFKRFLEQFRKRSVLPKKFANLEAIATQFDIDATVALEVRVQKGQYVLMNPFELWRAKRALRSR